MVGHGVDRFRVCGGVKKIDPVNKDQSHDQEISCSRAEKSVIKSDHESQDQAENRLLSR